jgi:hypothetical protein
VPAQITAKANTSAQRFGGGYRQLVTTDGKFVTAAIMRHAHRVARIEFDAHVRACAAAGEKNPITYAVIFKRELISAYGWARAIAGAGQGEAPARAVAQFRQAA